MKRRIVRTIQAKRDLIDHFVLIGEDNLNAAERFLDRVESAINQLADMPKIGSPRPMNNPRLEGLRVWPVPGFRRYLIFYLQIEDTVTVLRVLHSARDHGSLL